MFQSTRPRGARPWAAFTPEDRLSEFQSTRPRGARHKTWCAPVVIKCFNPRARVGRDLSQRSVLRAENIVSIHAPAWGATMESIGDGVDLPVVSIHAPAWGATHYDTPEAARAAAVSIHAPAWGATFSPWPARSTSIPFQSTRPRGARRSPRRAKPDVPRFNPRARVGRDIRLRLLY